MAGYEQRIDINPNYSAGRPDAGAMAAAAGSGFNPHGLQQLAGALGDVGDAVNAVDEANASAWAAKAVSEARLKWTQHFIDAQGAVEPGATGFTPKLLAQFDEYADKTIEAAPSARAGQFLQQRLMAFRSGLGESAMQFEAKARIDYRVDQYTQGIQNTQKLMNTDPGQYNVALAEQLAVIDAANLPPTQKSAMRQKAIDDVSEAAVWSSVQRNPASFLSSIGFNGGDGKTRKSSGDLMGVTGNLAFDALPFNKRIQMFEGAVRLKAQQDADFDKAAKEASKKIADDAMKEGWSRLMNGKLTAGYIERIRPLVDENNFHSLVTALKAERTSGAGGAKTDPATFRELQRLVYDDPKEAEKFAFRAHKAGQLSNEHLSAGLSRAREIDRSEGPKSEYERSRRYIVGSLEPGPLVQDPVGRARLAEAIDEFDRWATAEKRDDKDIRDRGRQIVDQYRFIDMSQTVLALPSPRSGQIRRNPQDREGMRNDILNAANKAKADRDSGKLTAAEYEAEMATLNRWRKTIEAK